MSFKIIGKRIWNERTIVDGTIFSFNQKMFLLVTIDMAKGTIGKRYLRKTRGFESVIIELVDGRENWNNMSSIERYMNIEDAKKGHNEILKKLEDGKLTSEELIKIGF